MTYFFRLIGVVFVVVAFASLFFIPAAWLRKPLETAATVSFTVRDGWTARDVADALSSAHLASATGYRLYSLIDPTATHPRTGDYHIPAGSNYRGGPSANIRAIAR